MTIAIGIKCNNGVVLACDSQSEYERGVDVKRLNQNKVFEHRNQYLFAGAGILSHIQILVEFVCTALDERIQQQRGTLLQEESEYAVEQTLLALHKHHNIDRSGLLGEDERGFFSPLVIFAGVKSESEFYLDLLHGNSGMVEPMIENVAIGSGAAYAELLFRSLYYSDMTVEEAIAVSAYMIDEVKAIDPHCGGNTQISTLTVQDETEEDKHIITTPIPHEVIASEYLNLVKPSLDLIRMNLIPKILRGELNEDAIREITENT